MIGMIVAFLTSAVVTLLIVRSAHMHGRHSGDHDFSKPQKFHAVAVPRIGGLGVATGLLAGILAWMAHRNNGNLALLLLACGLPAFLAGFVQDFTESLTPRGRLAATAVSALIAFFVVGAALPRAGIPGLDWLIGFTAGSLVFTVLTVAGIANAVNIIDGFNGLASMCVVIMLAAVAYVAFQVGDDLTGTMALIVIGATLGFFAWNFPSGHVFLGDGGAYLLGYLLSELSILLLVRNPEVSALFALLVCIYPTFETIFSIYRRRFLRAQPTSVPDGIHLHSLIHRRVMRWATGDQEAESMTFRNSMTSPFLWMLCCLSVVPAVLWWDNPAMLALALLAFAVSYVALYWRIVRFRSPRWMHAVARRHRRLAERDNPGT